LPIKNKAGGPETAWLLRVLTDVHRRKFLLIEGTLQNQENVLSVKADVVDPLEVSEMDVCSHDVH
jgi:hypothetical protein